MVFLVAGVVLVALTLYGLRGGLVGQNGLTVVGFDMQSLGVGGLSVVLAAVVFGPLYGIALILSIMIHEFGHVAAYRVIGHHDARFRLVPLMGGYAISDQLPARQKQSFFVSLLGPGISLAPMVLAFALADAMWSVQPDVANFLYVFGSVTAALNFFNLLPFWPLDGGHCLRMIAYSFSPRLANVLTIAMSAGLAAAGLAMQSLVLFAFALMGAQTMMHADTISRVQHPMTKGQSLLALAAYLFTAAAHLAGGWWLLSQYI